MTSASFGTAVIPSLSASIPAQERINFEFMGEEIDHGADAQRDVAARRIDGIEGQKLGLVGLQQNLHGAEARS